jgi:Uma2 family endonuclease
VLDHRVEEEIPMSTITKQKRTRRSQLDGERRWLIRDAAWDDYDLLNRLLPETFRLAFDGSNLEIMVTSPLHDDYADALDAFFKAVAGALGIAFKPYRSTTWARPEIERGIQADDCYYLDPAKIQAAVKAGSRKSRDARDYPNPDLAIETDLSSPKADRPSIYASLRIAELWIFDGRVLTISRLGKDASYRDVEESGFLPLRADQVPRWILEEDRSDYDRWTRRIRAWARRTLKKTKATG